MAKAYELNEKKYRIKYSEKTVVGKSTTIVSEYKQETIKEFEELLLKDLYEYNKINLEYYGGFINDINHIKNIVSSRYGIRLLKKDLEYFYNLYITKLD